MCNHLSVFQQRDINYGLPSCTKTNRRWMGVLVAVLILLLFACNSEQKTPLVRPCRQRTEQKLEKAVLIRQHPELGSMAGVSALAFSSSEILRVVYSAENANGNGKIISLKPETLQFDNIVSLGPVSVDLTRISPNGDRVYSAVRNECPNYPYLKNSKCWNMQGWEAETGKTVRLPESPNVDLRDFTISADGKWILKAKSGGGIDALVPNNSAHGFAFFREDAVRDITAVAFNANSDLVALGFRDETYLDDKISGAVRLFKWDGQKLEPPVTDDLLVLKLYAAEKTLSSAPLALALDSTNSWLAVQTAKSVELLNIPSMQSTHRIGEIPDSAIGVIAFSPSDSILAVGYSGGISILRVPDLKVLSKKNSSQVTGISFSPDGCLLAWGDVDGSVHIVNAPKP